MRLPASMSTRLFTLRDPRDRICVGLAGLHAVVLVLWPSWWVIALGTWWNANAIAHQFTHRRFFRKLVTDEGFSLFLSVLLGFPQRIWRQRHLAHHARSTWRWRNERGLAGECVAVASLWVGLAVLVPAFWVWQYLPGFAIAQGLCWLQGHYEHAGGATSTYARWWNVLFLNDGYHAEHHVWPRRHFRELPTSQVAGARVSRWPPVLRWLDVCSLEGLERVVLRSRWLQARVLDTHRRAIASLLPQCGEVRDVVIVGGGLFPRTALLLCELLPEARIMVVDASQRHLERARSFLSAKVVLREGRFTPGEELDADLVVVPLALVGDRESVYASPPGRCTLVHDWIWRTRGSSTVVSPLLCKRLNLVRRDPIALPVIG